MTLNRRDLLIGASPLIAGATLAATPTKANAKAHVDSILDLADSGLKPNAKQNQTKALQAAIDKASKQGKRLLLPGGTFISGPLTLRSNLHLEGVAGATKLKFAGGPGFLVGIDVQNFSIRNLEIDGALKAFGHEDLNALIALDRVKNFSVQDCLIKNSAINGFSLRQSSGQIVSCQISNCDVTGVFALDSTGLEVLQNHVSDCANNGILIWRSQKGYDGSLVANNRIERIAAKAGGTGQNGNGVNVFRAGSVVVSNNVIDDCTFSAVRNNGGDNVQIVNNSCTNLGEVALYSEFKFEGAVICNNVVDDAHVGISITNFNEGGRLATATGNLIRNIKNRKDVPGIGIAVEADTMVTGNVIEDVEGAGIGIGWAQYMRNVTANNNLIRGAEIGIGVSTHNEAGFALIATNMITNTKQGAIRAMDKDKPLGPDLSKSSSEAFRNLAVYGNVSL